LTPVTSKTDDFSTVPNSISTEFGKTGQNKKELVVDSSSTDEIASESSVTLTDNSPNLGESNSTTKSLGKRLPDTAPYTISFFHLKKKKININQSQRKIFSSGIEYTHSISMENKQSAASNQPFSFDMELTPGINADSSMRIINARFVSMAKAINNLQEQNKGFTQFMDEFNQVKAELIQVKDKLAEVTAERDALKRKYMGSAASIHADNKDRDHIRIPVKYAVARHFVRLGWVESETLQRMQTGDPLAPPREQGDS
jgi:hypothetical protein